MISWSSVTTEFPWRGDFATLGSLLKTSAAIANVTAH